MEQRRNGRFYTKRYFVLLFYFLFFFHFFPHFYFLSILHINFMGFMVFFRFYVQYSLPIYAFNLLVFECLTIHSYSHRICRFEGPSKLICYLSLLIDFVFDSYFCCCVRIVHHIKSFDCRFYHWNGNYLKAHYRQPSTVNICKLTLIYLLLLFAIESNVIILHIRAYRTTTMYDYCLIRVPISCIVTVIVRLLLVDAIAKIRLRK